MQRVKLALVCLLWLSLASAVSAQPSIDPPTSSGIATVQNVSGSGLLNGTYFDLRHVIGDGVGYQNSYSQVGAFTPFWMGEDAFIAPNARMIVTNSTQVGVNAGLVGRQYLNGLDRILGVYGYYDNDQDSNNFRYSQFTVGAETLGNWWDLRANGYFQNGNTSNFLHAQNITGGPFYVGNNIDFQGHQLRDQSLGGADAEFGIPMSPKTPWLRGYSGIYGYHTGGGNTIGYRGRLEATVSNDLTLGVTVSQDSIYGTNVNGVIDFKFSGFQPTRYFPNMTTRQRMLNPVQRNWRVATRTYSQEIDIAAINPQTNKPYFIVHVDNSAAPGGNGTIEHPFQHLVNAPQADIILVHLGNAGSSTTPVTGSTILSNNERLLGTGILSTVDLFAHYGSTTISSVYDLPLTSNTGMFPYVTNPAGNIVTLANNNEVTGLNLFNSAGTAITNTAAGSNNFNLHDLEITGNLGKGIALTSASGIGIINNINTGTQTIGGPTPGNNPGVPGLGLNSGIIGVVGNNAGGGIQLSTGGPGLNLTLSDVNMNSNPAGLQPFGVALAANLGALNVGMKNVFTNDNGTGIQLSEQSQPVSVTMNNVRSNDNTGVGIQVEGTGGYITINANNIAAMRNGSDNLQIGTQATPLVLSTVNVTLTDSNFSNSTGGSGITFGLAGGTGNLSLLGSSTVNDMVMGNHLHGLSLFGTNSAVLNAVVDNGQFMGNGGDAFHVVEANQAIVNLMVDPTNASGSGGNGLYYSLIQGSTLNVNFTNDNLNNSQGSAVYGNLDNSTVNLLFTGTTGSGSGGDGFYLKALNGSLANLEIDGGSMPGTVVGSTVGGFSNSGTLTPGSSAVEIIANNSSVNLLMDNTAGNNLVPNTVSTLGTQAYGLKLDLSNGSNFSGTIENGGFSDALINAMNVNVTSGSAAALTLFNTSGNNSGADGYVANVNAASLTTTFTNLSNLNNSVGNGMTFTVANGGTMNTIFNVGNINNSGGDGINGTVTDATSTAFITIENGGTVNNSGANGLNFNVNAGTLGVSAFSSSFSNSGFATGAGSGVLGLVTNAGLAEMNFINTGVNNNLDNGIFVTTNTGGNIQAAFSIGSIDGNGTTGITARNNDGIRLDMNGATNSYLHLFNGASVNGNGNDGVTILASNSTHFQGVFNNISILGNGAVTPPVFGQTSAGVDVETSSSSNVGLSFDVATIGNTATGGTQQTGFLSNTTTGGVMTALFTTTTLDNNAVNGINSTTDGTGSTTNIELVNTTGDSNGNAGAFFDVTNGGNLLVTSSVNSGFSNNGGAGIFVAVDGTNSVASLDLDLVHLNNNGAAFGGQGFNGLASNGGTLNGCIMDGSTLFNNANQGISLVATNANSVINFNISESDIASSGSEGLLVGVSNQAVVNYRSYNTTYNGNGLNGTLSGVNVLAVGDGLVNDQTTARLLFSGGSIDTNTGDGLTLNAQNGATLTTSINAVDISHNGGYGINASATGATTQFNLLMSGANTLSNNGSGPISSLNFSNIQQAAIVLSGSFNNSPGDGVQVVLQNVTNALVAVEGPGTINSSGGDGIDVSMTNVTNGSVLINGVTSINNSANDGIQIAFNNVSNGAIGIQGPTEIAGSGGSAIAISLVNSALVDNMTFPTTNLTVLTLSNNLATPLNGCLPAPVSLTFNSLGLVPTEALSIVDVTAVQSGTTAFSITGTNSSIQTINVANNTISSTGSGDGIHFNLTSTPVTTLFLTGNSIGSAAANGVNFDLNGSPIGTVNIANNSIGFIQAGPSPLSTLTPLIIPGLNSNNLGAEDDLPSAQAALGFSPDFFGTTYSSLWVNNNENVTFDQALSQFTPFSLLTTQTPIIAPFFADVDTRAGNTVTYGEGTIAGHAAFAVNWLGVEHYNATDPTNTGTTNTFQLVMIDRSDIAPGDFDFEFNYQQIQWESGQASGSNAAGLGGSSARAGYSNGSLTSPATLELAGSAVNGALLDSGPATTSLIHNSLNSPVDGRYVFEVRNGLVTGVSPNGADGIRLNATNASNIGALNVVSNTISNSGKNGVEILQTNSDVTNPTFTGNTIQNNAGDGIRLVNPITHAGTTSITTSFQGNTITSNGGAGVNMTLVNGAQNLHTNFTSNTISSNTAGAGINIQLANNRNLTGNFVGNTVSSNGLQGIDLKMGLNGVVTSDFIGNTINGNKADGIDIALANGGQFIGNNFYGNTIGTATSMNGGIGVNLTVPNAAQFTWNLGNNAQASNLITGNTGAGVYIAMTGASTGTLNVENSEFAGTAVGTSPLLYNGEGLNVNQGGSSYLTGSISNSLFTANTGDGALFVVGGVNPSTFSELDNFSITNSSFSTNANNGLEFVRSGFGNIGDLIPAGNAPILIQGNTFNGNGTNPLLAGNGLAITSGGKYINTITHNLIVDNYTINNNTMSNNVGNGIQFSLQADANLNVNMNVGLSSDMNLISNNGKNGIQLTENVGDVQHDLRALTGTWQYNVITNNKGNGIALDGQVNNLLIGDLGNSAVMTGVPDNIISNNGQNGIEVGGSTQLLPGSSTDSTLTISNNLIMENGTLANLGTAAQNAGIMLDVAPNINYITNQTPGPAPVDSTVLVNNNEILKNNGDGIEYGINQHVPGYALDVTGFSAKVSIDSNLIMNNAGRGVNLINRGNNYTEANISNNNISGNALEGVYVVNTSNWAQNQNSYNQTQLTALYAGGGVPLTAATGNVSVDQVPILELRVVGNTILGNGLGIPGQSGTGSGLGGTGLYIAVGTSDGGYGYNNPGGYASNGHSLTLGQSPFTNGGTVGTNFTGYGGVTAVVDSNTFGGNSGNDVAFQSFVSTAPPPATTGTWSTTQFNITNYWGDPLSRFDLYFRNNTTDPGSIDALGNSTLNLATSTNGYVGDYQNLVAYYNNGDSFKRNQAATPDTTASGPFHNGDAGYRNATRQAARIQFYDRPNPGTDGGTFLYAGMGSSTWRVSSDSTAFVNMLSTSGYLDAASPVTNTNQENGLGLFNSSTDGSQLFGWGEF